MLRRLDGARAASPARRQLGQRLLKRLLSASPGYERSRPVT